MTSWLLIMLVLERHPPDFDYQWRTHTIGAYDTKGHCKEAAKQNIDDDYSGPVFCVPDIE